MADLLDHLSAALLAEGMQALVLNARGGSEVLPSVIERMLEYRVRAVVMLSGSPSETLVSECVANSVRMILVNRYLPDIGGELIHSDDAAGADLAFERLCADGRRRLAVVGPGTGTSSMTRRLGRFVERARDSGMECQVWASGSGDYETGVMAARSLHNVDGVFAVTDLIALGLLNTMRHEQGLSVPHDVSLIGFDNVPEAGWSSHQLTTLHQDRPRFAAEIVARIMAQPPTGADSLTILPVTLIERGTTLPGRTTS